MSKKSPQDLEAPRGPHGAGEADIVLGGEGFYTRAGLARRINRNEMTLFRWERRGRGPAVTRVGKTVLYRVRTVEAWLRSLEQEPRPRRGMHPLAKKQPRQREATCATRN